jgi:hypothetical protein
MVVKNEVAIAMGSSYGLEAGMTLVVRKNGEILRHPDTGAILDRLEGEVCLTGALHLLDPVEKL